MRVPVLPRHLHIVFLLATVLAALLAAGPARPVSGQSPTGTIYLAKVVLGDPADATWFSAEVVGDPSQTYGFSQATSGAIPDVPLDAPVMVRELLPVGYDYVGWAFGTFARRLVCPDAPQSDRDAAEVTLTEKSPQAVICFYNRPRQNDQPGGPAGELIVRKVIPGFPEDETPFTVELQSPTFDSQGVFPRAVITQSSPATFTLFPNEPHRIQELLLNTPYRYLGWSFGWYKGEASGCPEQPENTAGGWPEFSFDPDRDGTGPFVICLYNAPGRRAEPVDPVDPDLPRSGTILVRKVIPGAPGDETLFTVEVSQAGSSAPPSTAEFSQQQHAKFSPLPPGIYRVRELPAPGYATLGWAYGHLTVGKEGPVGLSCPEEPQFEGGETTVEFTGVPPSPENDGPLGDPPIDESGNILYCFYNAPAASSEDPQETGVTIRIEKTENVVGFEHPGAGWSFTVSGCGIKPRTVVTGPDGSATVDALPPAIACSYTVSETPRPGWTALTPSQEARPQQPGETVTLRFLNIRDWNPPCLGFCGEVLPPTDSEPPAPATPAPQVPVPTPPAAATPAPGAGGPPASSSNPGPQGPNASLATPIPPATGNGHAPEPPPLAWLLVALASASLGASTLALAALRR